MPFTSNGPGGPLTEWAKTAGFLSAAGNVALGAGKAVGSGVASLGKGVWNAAGHLAPHPVARAGLIGATALTAGSQVPQLAGRISQDASFVRGQGPAVKGF